MEMKNKIVFLMTRLTFMVKSIYLFNKLNLFIDAVKVLFHVIAKDMKNEMKERS